MRSVLHIDVNSAYLSWTAAEMRKRGAAEDIRLLPAAIAGDPKNRHGIILAKSEAAKKHGIRTAMTLSEARRRCPNLVVFPPDHELYKKYSDRMFALLSQYTDVVERFSIDECWLEYTGSEKIFGDPLHAAQEISARIKNELGFTVNIGISVNKLLAKMASEREKPDHIHTLYPEEIPEKMWPLATDELFGVGRMTKAKLENIGLSTIGDVAKADISMLKSLLKPVMGRIVHDHANGVDDSPVVREEDSEQKGVGNSVTTPADIKTEEAAFKVLLALSEKVGIRARGLKKKGGVISVELKNSDFGTYRHQRKLRVPISTTTEIYENACEIFREMWRGDSLRLLGVHLGQLTEENETPRQLSLFDEAEPAALNTLETVTDRIRDRYGKEAITRGALLKKK
jgi:DNA polymerase-4